MANWANDKFKTWLKEIDAPSLSQEQLKKEAIVFSEYFAEVDKKTIAKVVDDFEKVHKQVLADVSHSIFEEMGGQVVAFFLFLVLLGFVRVHFPPLYSNEITIAALDSWPERCFLLPLFILFCWCAFLKRWGQSDIKLRPL